MPEPARTPGLSRRQAAVKRAFDLVVAGTLALVTSPVTVAATVAARLDTGESGIFAQERVGKDGHTFRVYKLRTMRSSSTHTTTATAAGDPRITRLGRWLRRLKIDELPQLINVVRGEMSLVGPRPDVPGWADRLQGEDRVVLSVRPGITGPATLAYRHEETLLAQAPDPETYNREVIWPEKVRLNRDYVRGWSFAKDLRYLADTVRSVLR